MFKYPWAHHDSKKATTAVAVISPPLPAAPKSAQALGVRQCSACFQLRASASQPRIALLCLHNEETRPWEEEEESLHLFQATRG